MDNRAQISMEYLLIVSALMVIASIILILALNLFSLKDGIKNRGIVFVEEISEMIG